MYKMKLQKILKCLWPLDIVMLVVKRMFFFIVFTNHFQKIHRSVLHKITIDLLYFWDVSDASLIMVKLCFIETRLRKGYDLHSYFLKMTRETINILTITVIHYFYYWTSFRSLNFIKLLRTPLLIEHLSWLLLVFSFKLIFLSFYIKVTGL